jgi:hypothetical protein
MMRTYFAYSFTLSPTFQSAFSKEQQLKRPAFLNPRLVELSGFELVYETTSDRWNGRVAGLKRGNTSVWGVLYDVDEETWSWVQSAESSIGAKPMDVELRVDGHAVKAFAFSPPGTLESGSELVSEAFVATLLDGVISAGLPSHYVDRLCSEAAILESVQRFGRSQLGLGERP